MVEDDSGTPAGNRRARRAADAIALGIALVATLARIAIARRTLGEPETWIGDARVFLRIGEGLLAGSPPPEIWIWSPAFPLLSLPAAAVFGPGFGLVATALAAGVALPLLAWLVGRALGRPVAGAGAGVVLAFLPEAILASARPLSDALAPFLVSLGTIGAALALRRDRALLAAGAGLALALATLVRPEAILAALAAPLLALCRTRPRIAAALAAALVVGLAPWTVALHSASGAWALSLKGSYNLAKLDAYQAPGSYAEQRASWERVLVDLRDSSGRLDPTRVASAGDPVAFVTSGRAFRAWGIHLAQGARRVDPWFLGLLAAAAVGWARPGRRSRDEGTLAAMTALPFLAVPVFLNPTGRFLLPLFPALAWGAGRAAEWAADRVADRAADTARGRPRPTLAIARAIGTGVVVVGIVAGIGSASRRAEADRWRQVAAEVEVALGAGRADRALELLAPFEAGGAPPAELALARGRALEARGDRAGAEGAYRESVSHGASPVVLADLVARSGRTAEAEALLEPLAADPPDDFAYWNLLGNLAASRARWDDAVAAYARAAEHPEAPPELAFNLGLSLAKAGRIEAARRVLDRAARGGPPPVAERARGLLERLDREAPGR